VQARELWEVVCYPAIAEEDETHLIETPLETRLVTRSRGEALHPERQPVAILAARSANIILPASTNRCCRPRAAAWSRRRGSRATNERSDKFDQIVQSWGTANNASELSDFSVCTSWASRARTCTC
jgi:hypothetical protein